MLTFLLMTKSFHSTHSLSSIFEAKRECFWENRQLIVLKQIDNVERIFCTLLLIDVMMSETFFESPVKILEICKQGIDNEKEFLSRFLAVR